MSAFDLDKIFHNKRTGEVVPAGSDAASGRVWVSDGRVLGTIYGGFSGTREYASVEDALLDVGARR